VSQLSVLDSKVESIHSYPVKNTTEVIIFAKGFESFYKIHTTHRVSVVLCAKLFLDL